MSLKIENLNFYYGSLQALKDIQLVVNSGQITALIGPNGAGKSSLVKVISGVLPAKSGKILWNAQNLQNCKSKERARIISVVSQAQTFAGAFSVEETVLLGRTPHMGSLGIPNQEDLGITKWAMERTGVAAFANRHIAELSGGEQQRVLLARALAQDTPVLLMDEPTNHLDLNFQMSILDLVSDLVIEKNMTVLLALHDLNLVSLYAEQIVMMDRGMIISSGNPEEVLDEERLTQVYKTELGVVSHPLYNTPMILPLKSKSPLSIQRGEVD